MIAQLRGTITEKNDDRLILMVNGVGYEVMVTASLLSSLPYDQEVTLYTYLSIRENAHELFGFNSRIELEFFKRLLTISGVGPKTALHILSLGPVDDLTSAIMRGDTAYLTKVAGIGKKTAERIVVELKGKLGALAPASSTAQDSSATDDTASVILALEQLGYSHEEARQAAVRVADVDGPLENKIKAALSQLGR